MFTMNKTWEKIFYFFTYLFQGSSFLSPKAYGIMHRLHHAYADTEKDPHSPKFSHGLLDMMWKTKNIYNDILNSRFVPEAKFLKNIPDNKFIEWLGDQWISRVAWGTAYSVFYIVYATEWWMYLLLPIHFLMGPVHGAIINWFAHKYGYIHN
jgi:stearoyl-CoA desaturase (delta-9 desaturase)